MNFRIRFQIGVTATILAITVSLTVATLVSVYLASTHAAKETATRLFLTTARQAYGRLDTQLGGALALADLGATKSGPLAIHGSGLDMPELPFMFAALANNPSLYAVFYALDTGAMQEVIASRNDDRILKSSKAPPGTFWIVRTISGEGRDRVQKWSFLDAGQHVLGMATDFEPAFDPRQRPWYLAAKASDHSELSAPFIFDSLKEPGLTASRRFAGGVFAINLTLTGLDQMAEEQVISAHGGVILFDPDERVLAMTRALAPDRKPLDELASLPSAAVKVVQHLAIAPEQDGTLLSSREGGTEFMLSLTQWKAAGQHPITIAVVAPTEDFVGHIRTMQEQILLSALTCLAVFLPGAMIFGHKMGARVRALASDALRMRNMDFEGDDLRPSRIIEFNYLSESFHVMKVDLSAKTGALTVAQQKLARLVDLGIAMSAERDSNRLMEMVLLGAKELTNADGCSLFLRGDDNLLRYQILHSDRLDRAMGTSGQPETMPPIAMTGTDGQPNRQNPVARAVYQGETINIADAFTASDYDFAASHLLDERLGYQSRSMLVVPLMPRGGGTIGALQLINARLPGADGEIVPFSADIQRFVEALAAQAATSLFNRDLLSAQERLMDAIIQLIAGAIDAKSPYTGGHCERVPELAEMLAQEAMAKSDGPFADFRFESEDEWREFRIGAWLHDCGKVVTPEYIVDKATKLETIYNRIHEIRMRYEVLLRDADITRLEAIAAGTDPTEAAEVCQRQKERLLDDFAFVAECNVGGEHLAPEKVERLKSIATNTWWRHIDNRLGLGHEELKRHEPDKPETLPVREPLLADKPFHIIPRDRGINRAYQDLGFKVNIPENLYNHGEVYNLSVSRGTLTEEDRFKINEHIMQTIAMLETLPFPDHLKRVPEYAGTHHETLIGSGYPRQLDRENLSIPARIMAIADIFEALTAYDRPYKKPKTLSECIRLLSGFKKNGHIDPDLFDLFLASGIYQRYAEKYLLPSQIDRVDVSDYLQ